MPPMIDESSGSLSDIMIQTCCTTYNEDWDGFSLVFFPVVILIFVLCKISQEKSGIHYRSNDANGWGH